MLYMDLTANGTVVFTGMVCLNTILIGNYGYLPFVGALFFYDTQGQEDPSSPGLNSRYQLIYYSPDTGLTQVQILDEPSQQFDVLLDTQQCTISLYTT
jgi:hypothetical protein